MTDIFVFGSNLAGRHGKGAALAAKNFHGAVYGVGEGRTGTAYAIPTKDENLKSLPLDRIQTYVTKFLDYAKINPNLTFRVTKIGCGLAGYTPTQIGPMFSGAPLNVDLPPEFTAMALTRTVFYAGIGSRETPSEILKLMTKIAEKQNVDGLILRSGGADGADTAFERGAGSRKEIWVPWIGFNDHPSTNIPKPAAYEMAAKFHPAWHKCSLGARKLHARNVHQVLGRDLKTPITKVICWTKDAAGGGGTGQAIRIAKAHEILIHDLADPKIRTLYE